MPKGRRESKDKAAVVESHRVSKVVGAGVVLVVLACFVVSLWLMSQAPAPQAAVAAPESEKSVVEAERVVGVDPFANEDLLSEDPVVVAGAVVDLRDEWFYAENDVLMASIDEVFGTAVSQGALFVLDGLSLQRASLFDAPEPNKTFYHAESISARVLGTDEDGVLVEVWDMEVISRRNLIEPQAQWGRQRLFLEQNEAGRWIVTDWSVVEGPAPRLTQGLRPSDATELEIDLEGHARLSDWLGITTNNVEAG